MKTLYKTTVTATGGRDGHIKSDNGILELDVRMPKALGGQTDDFANPEMLFAAGYAACFDSALNLIIKKAKSAAGETTVKATAGIGQIENEGFGLEVELDVNVPGISLEEAQYLVEQAHQICPYSNATRNNIEVTLKVTNN
ncbi:MAG: organic hydroperoxide resistance protein [Kaistella sp.]|nr:organic hydroperoxide resistance protein [Kaistella sp.]